MNAYTQIDIGIPTEQHQAIALIGCSATGCRTGAGLAAQKRTLFVA
jgi:hypothetical protein